MSEINNPKDIKFDIKNRNFSIKKNDFKEDSKELFLFNYLTDNKQNKFFKLDNKIVSIHMLDKEENTEGMITSNDIQIFLQDKKIQKKGITENDVVKFLNKMMKLNPTEEEKALNNISNKYKDENGKSIMNDEMKKMFGLERGDTQIADNKGKVKKGLEIFDLNNDGKIDEIEKEFAKSNNVQNYSNLDDLNKYLDSLDKMGSENRDTKDGVITQSDKQKAYEYQNKKIIQEKTDLLNKLDIKNENNEQVITDEVKGLFTGKNGTISLDEITDQSGNVKKGLELFDLNGDGKLDENEKNYFANGGRSAISNNNKLTIVNLTKAIDRLDFAGVENGSNYNNSKITTNDKKGLHKMLSSSSYMLENLGSFPDKLQDKFADALKNKYFYNIKNKSAIGVNNGDSLGINSETISKPEIASVMAHELTHAILTDTDNPMDTLQQEVVTFYTEYRFYENAKKNDSDFMSTISKIPDSGIKEVVVDTDYMNFIENLRKNNPTMSEKDLAIEAFIKFKFNSYNGMYKAKITPDELRKADYSLAEDFFKRK